MDVAASQKLNSADYSRQRIRFSDALFDREEASFSSFAALPSNVKAIEAALLFGSGLHSHVAVVGPSGWGKSHLLKSVAAMLRRETGTKVQSVSALEWLVGNPRWDGHLPLVLDDAEDVIHRPRARQQMRLFLERRVRSGRPTLLSFTAANVDRQIKSFLPNLREWTIAQIAEPQPSERELVVRQIASAQGIFLSSRLLRLLSCRVTGNGRSLAGAIQRLNLVQGNWLEENDFLRAIGVLSPHLGDPSGWDIRDQVYEVVSQIVRHHQGEFDATHLVLDMTSHIMMNHLGLSESDVASYLKIEPGEVYQRAGETSKMCRAGAVLALEAQCIQALVNSMDNC